MDFQQPASSAPIHQAYYDHSDTTKGFVSRTSDVQHEASPAHQYAQREPATTSNTRPLLGSPSSHHEASEKPRVNPGWWSTILSRLNEWWFWEFFGLIGSALTLVAIVMVLHQYDSERQPSWERMSLNTLISWLSTLAKLLVFIPLSTAIGQLKWLWMAERQRHLADIGAFDSASRGVLGSIRLLWTVKGWHFVGLGAFATILAVAFDPFNQNLIHYYQASFEDTSQFAYLANASGYDTYGPLLGGSAFQVDPVLKANVYNSIFNPNAYQSWGIPTFVCGSGNCTWDPFYSLEAKALCSNITSHLEKNCSYSSTRQGVQCNLTIPNGVSTSYLIPSTKSNWGGTAMVVRSPDQPLIYTNVSTKDLSQRAPSIFVTQWITALGLNANQGAEMFQKLTNETKWISTECSLELYVRRVNASVQRSIYQESTLSTWSKMAYHDVPGVTGGVYFNIVVPELGAQSDSTFYFGYEAYEAIARLLGNINGTVSGVSDSLGFGSANTISSDILQTLFTQNFTNCGTPDDRLACMMTNVAAAVSKTFRDSALTSAIETGFNASASDTKNAARMNLGQTMISAVFVSVRWQWLSLPVVVWVLTAVTWIGTAFFTRHARLAKWGNNVLPLLFLYRESDTYVGPSMDADERMDSHGVNSMVYTLQAQSLQAKLSVGPRSTKLM